MTMKRYNFSEIGGNNGQYDILPAGTLVVDDSNNIRLHDGTTEGGNIVGSGNANTGDITFNNSVISTQTGSTVRIESTTDQYDQNAVEFNNKNLDLYAYNDDSGSYSELRLENTDNDYPWALINVKAANQQEESRWAFAANGELTFPDGTKQTTAYTGQSGSSSDSNVWIETFESATPETDLVALASSVEYDADGNIIALFLHSNTQDSSTYTSVGKYSSTGAKLWTVRFGNDVTNTDGWGLAVGDGAIYVTGRSGNTNNNDTISTLTKLSGINGSVVWSKTYNFGYTSTSAVVDVAADGNPVMVGYVDNNGSDSYVSTTKVSANDGSIIWTRKLDGQQDEEAYGMAVGPDGEIVVIGFISLLNFGSNNSIAAAVTVPSSNPNWISNTTIASDGVYFRVNVTDGVPTITIQRDEIGGRTVGDTIATINGSVFGGTDGVDDMVVNVASVTAEGSLDDHMLVVKYDENGSVQWQKAILFDAGFDCSGADADIDSNGNVYVVGSYQYNDNGSNTSAMNILKLDNSGNKQWSRRVSGNCQTFATSVVVGPDDKLYLSGVTGNNNTADFIWVAAKYNFDGTVEWQRLIDNTNSWSFNGGMFFGAMGGSNIAVKQGYVALGGGFGNLYAGQPPHATVVQVSSVGTTFSVSEWDFKSASFSGQLDDTASDIGVFDAGLADLDNSSTVVASDITPEFDASNFLIGTVYAAGTNNIGDVTFTGVTIQGNGSSYGDGGLYLSPGPELTPNNQYFRVRGGDNETHLHLDTGDNSTYDQYFGDDGKYLKLDHGGNISIATDSNEWIFNTSGDLSIPGSINLVYGALRQNNYESDVVISSGRGIVISTDEDADQWTFDTSGVLTLPEGGDIKDSNGNSVLGNSFTTARVAGQDDILAAEAGNTLELVAGDNITLTTNASDGTITIAATSNTTPQYGYFSELMASSSELAYGKAVVMDSDSNSYVSYTYYDDNIGNDAGGIAKFDSTGEKVWAVDITSPNSDARNPEITSLELVTIDSTTSLVALGYYYDNNTNKDVAVIYYFSPTDGSVNTTLTNVELVTTGGMNVKDGVAGYDGSNPYAVVVGETYDQTVIKTLTPLAGSTTDKLFISWADFAASGVNTSESLYYYDGPNQYGVTMNAIGVAAIPAGSSDPRWAGISITVSTNEAGNYVITGPNGWGYLVNGWSDPVTLTVPGSYLGGVDNVNDLTFDFSNATFNNDSANFQAAISNIQGTPVTGVYCPGWGGYDWSTQIGNTLNFNYQLNNQAYVARFGQSGSWTQNFGGGSYDRMYSVVVDGDLNTYAVGYSWNGSRSSLVVKYDYEGTQQWAVYIDPSDNTGNGLMSVDLLSDGNLVTVDEDGVVTKLDSSNGDIIWQVKADTDPSWDGDFRGTATPDGDYIITNYEDNDYTQYAMRISGTDGSSVWNKRITRTYGGDNGEMQADDGTQYIDCNATNLTIAGRTYPPNGNSAGIVYSFPINGENTDGTYGQYVISNESMNWTTKSTTSIAATVNNTFISVSLSETNPSSNVSPVNVSTSTPMGGAPVVEPTVITWNNPNGNTWRIEEYNGGAGVSYNGSDYDAKWFDVADSTSGNNDFRGAIIQYHAYCGAGNMIGTIHLANDYTQQEATHTEHLSGNSNMQFMSFWVCNNERGQLFFKRTDGNSQDVMIQWTAKIFYGSEYNC